MLNAGCGRLYKSRVRLLREEFCERSTEPVSIYIGLGNTPSLSTNPRGQTATARRRNTQKLVFFHPHIVRANIINQQLTAERSMPSTASATAFPSSSYPQYPP